MIRISLYNWYLISVFSSWQNS